MAKFKLFLIISFVILLFSGCSEPQESAPTLPPAAVYDQMAQAIGNAPTVSIRYAETTTMTQGSNTYTYEDRQQLLLNTKTGDFQSSGTLFYGPHNVIYEKIYKDRTLYLTVNHGKFSGNYRNLQNLLPQPGMFTEHTFAENGNDILFSDPDGSFWPIPENATVTAANGTLTSSATMQYTISYKAGNTAFQTEVSLEYEASDATIPQPNANSYIPLKDVTAPLVLEKAYGLLQESIFVSAEFTEEISSAVNTLDYKKHLFLNRTANNGRIQNETVLTNYSRPDDTKTVTQTEAFQNGNYTISLNGNPPQIQGIDQTQFFQHFIQQLSENILAAKYVRQANAEITDDGILFCMQTNKALAENLYGDIWNTLYNNPDYLNQQLAEYQMDYAIIIDPITGLPASCRLIFSSSSAIAGISYPLTANQQLTITYQ